MKKNLFILGTLLLLLSVTSSVLKISIDELSKAMKVVLEVFTILFTSSGVFVFSISINNNKVVNGKDKIKNNTVEGDLTINKNTTFYGSQNDSGVLVPVLNRLVDAIENKQKENVENIQTDIGEKASHMGVELRQPNEDFMFRYVESGRSISDKEIQKVWADLYIKEATKPSSISFRTLEIVKNLTFDEMNLFLKILDYCINVGDTGYIPREICKDNISLFDITRLGDIGLLKSETTLNWVPTFFFNSNYNLIVGNTLLQVQNSTGKDFEASIPVYILTDAGAQLASAINCWIKEEHSIEFGKYLKNKYRTLSVFLYKIVSVNSDGNIQHETNNLV